MITQQHLKVYHLISKPNISRYPLLLIINIITKNIKSSERKRIPLYFKVQKHLPFPTYDAHEKGQVHT
jgi:hypothetical protein